MSHDYDTRNKKKSAEMSQDSLDKLEKSIVQGINRLEDEIINLNDIVIKNFQDENARLKEKCEKLENRVAILESNHNDLVQYGRRNNVVFSGIPENVTDNNLDSIAISSYQSCRTLMCKWSQEILRPVIKLTSQLRKRRRPLLDLLTEKIVKRF